MLRRLATPYCRMDSEKVLMPCRTYYWNVPPGSKLLAYGIIPTGKANLDEDLAGGAPNGFGSGIEGAFYIRDRNQAFFQKFGPILENSGQVSSEISIVRFGA